MLVLEEIPQPTRERLDRIGAAGLVIGLLVPAPPEALEATLQRARESVAKLYTQTRTVVLYPATDSPLPAFHSPLPEIELVPFPLASPGHSLDPADSIRAACDTVFAVAGNLNARAISIIVSDLDHVTAHWIYGLVRPILELDFDVVTPCYAHGKLEGLLNSAIVAPLTRALYGRRIQHPLGPDFGFSGRFAHHVAEQSRPADRRSLASLTLDAICYGFEICQANVGLRHYPPIDWMNQSSVLVQILDPVFREMDHRASFWQRVRGSQPVPAFGEAHDPAPELSESLDPRRMFESFELGCRNLQDVWGAILPPGALLELNKLARGSLESFHLPDRLWARIIYDFALGHHLRTFNPDQLLRAMTPLYLAWVASYALEPDSLPVSARLELLALAFEQSKPYALSRWRWPDRFNP
jgi:glucosylglycerate synthase